MIVSRGGVPSFADPAATFRNPARGLMPGGRLALVCPGSRSGPDRIRAVLDGWENVKDDWENVEVGLRGGIRLVTADRPRRMATDVD